MLKLGVKERYMRIKFKFGNLYKKIKLMLYKSMFKKIKDNGESLTTTEYLCLECIYLMNKPTITEFAQFLDISSPNATYKIKTLMNKGFLSKEKSKKDGREYRLVPTQKFFDFFENKDEMDEINGLRDNFNKHENKQFDKILKLMEEV